MKTVVQLFYIDKIIYFAQRKSDLQMGQLPYFTWVHILQEIAASNFFFFFQILGN